jgi:O-antigen ligase
MIAKRGIGYMMTHPLFGIGVNNFPMAEGTISERAKEWRPEEAGIRWAAAHNSYIQVGAEMGIPGLVLWCSLVIGGVVVCWRLRRRTRAWRVGDPEQRLIHRFTEILPLSIIGFGASAFFVSFAYMDPVYILAAYVTGLYVAVEAIQRRETAARAQGAGAGGSVPASGPGNARPTRGTRRGRRPW